jgi:translation initiation factor 2 subunit 1
MTKRIDFPEEDELVVCTIKGVKDYGAFVSMEEYEQKEGFIHVSEIATGWVKRMSDFAREGQRLVCKVLRVDSAKGHVDLSLKRVNAHQKREKIQQWKNEQRAAKLMEIVAERCKKTVDKCYETFGDPLIDKYGSLYEAFETAATKPELVEKDGFKGAWLEHFMAVAKDNVQISKVEISGTLELTTTDPEGIEAIKAALHAAKAKDVGIQYIGAPKYRLTAIALDYPTAEEMLKKSAEKAISYMSKHGGEGKYARKEKE